MARAIPSAANRTVAEVVPEGRPTAELSEEDRSEDLQELNWISIWGLDPIGWNLEVF